MGLFKDIFGNYYLVLKEEAVCLDIGGRTLGILQPFPGLPKHASISRIL